MVLNCESTSDPSAPATGRPATREGPSRARERITILGSVIPSNRQRDTTTGATATLQPSAGIRFVAPLLGRRNDLLTV
jgi:hypothetical protein